MVTDGHSPSWTDLRVPTDPSFHFGWCVVSRWCVLSKWTSQFVQFRIVEGREILSPRHGLRDTYNGAQFDQLKMIWKICEFSFIIVQQVSLPLFIGPRWLCSLSTILWESPGSFSEQQVLLHFLNNQRFSRPVRRTCPLLLRTYWADWRRWSCEEPIQRCCRRHRSVWTIFLFLLLRKDPRSKARNPRNTGCPIHPNVENWIESTVSRWRSSWKKFPKIHYIADSHRDPEHDDWNSVWTWAIARTNHLHVNVQRQCVGRKRKQRIVYCEFQNRSRICKKIRARTLVVSWAWIGIEMVRNSYLQAERWMGSYRWRRDDQLWVKVLNQSIFSFHELAGLSLILPMHKTESEHTWVFVVDNWTARSVNRVRPFPRIFLPVDHGDTWDFFLIPDQILCHIEHLFHCSLSPIFGWMWILQIIVSKMNCRLLGDHHEHSPYQRIHIEVLHFVFWLALELLSQIRVDFLEMLNVSTRFAEIVRQLRVVFVVDIEVFSGKFPCTFCKNSDLGSCLQQRVSSHVRSSVHL